MPSCFSCRPPGTGRAGGSHHASILRQHGRGFAGEGAARTLSLEGDPGWRLRCNLALAGQVWGCQTVARPGYPSSMAAPVGQLLLRPFIQRCQYGHFPNPTKPRFSLSKGSNGRPGNVYGIRTGPKWLVFRRLVVPTSAKHVRRYETNYYDFAGDGPGIKQLCCHARSAGRF